MHIIFALIETAQGNKLKSSKLNTSLALLIDANSSASAASGRRDVKCYCFAVPVCFVHSWAVSLSQLVMHSVNQSLSQSVSHTSLSVSHIRQPLQSVSQSSSQPYQSVMPVSQSAAPVSQSASRLARQSSRQLSIAIACLLSIKFLRR